MSDQALHCFNLYLIKHILKHLYLKQALGQISLD